MKRTLVLLAALVTLASPVYAQTAQAERPQPTNSDAAPIQGGAPPSGILNWFNILGLVIGVVGVVGTVYTIRAWRRSEQDRRVLQYLFETAEKNLEKGITEEDIKRKKQEATEIAADIQTLQEQLREDIPREARRAVLRDKLFSQELLVTQTYSSIQELRRELGPQAPTSNIPPEVAAIIEREISPEYLIREQRSQLKNQLTVMTTAAAIFSAVFPDPIGTVVSIPIFLLAVPVVWRLYKSYLPKDALGRKVYMYRVAAVGCFLGVTGALLYPASLALQGVPLYRGGLRTVIAVSISLGFLLFGLIFVVLHFIVSRRSRRLMRPPVPKAS